MRRHRPAEAAWLTEPPSRSRSSRRDCRSPRWSGAMSTEPPRPRPVGLLPVPQREDASFHVVPDKGFYHCCFGCGQHGNAIDFVMALEGVEFAQALQRLAELTGLPAPRLGGEASPGRPDHLRRQSGRRAGSPAVSRPARAPGSRVSAGARARPGVIERFGLGYAPDERTALKRAMLAEGYPRRSCSRPACWWPRRTADQLRSLPRSGDVSDPGSARAAWWASAAVRSARRAPNT